MTLNEAVQQAVEGGRHRNQFNLPPVEERFWEKVNKTEHCWVWEGARNSGGYGGFRVAGKYVPAHRFVYELLVGPIPTGLEIDHLCRNHSCVNPEHLEPVSHATNTLRGNTLAALNKAKTHCRRGHPYDAINTYVSKGKRYCRLCDRVKYQVRRERLGVSHGTSS